MSMVSAKNILLVCLSLLVSVIIAEMVLRITDAGGYSTESRVLFYSFPSFILDDNGAVRYKPDTDIRIVAVYGKYIEFDNVGRTNNLGFLDSRDYVRTPTDDHGVVFVGDSFTAGSGGTTPLVGLLREFNMDTINTAQLYNLGVGGTGIHHFSRLLKSFQKEIAFDEINIMVISGDFFRSFWYPLEEKEQLWFCNEFVPPVACKKRRRPIIHRIDFSETRESILEHADRISRQKNVKKGHDTGLPGGSRLYGLLCDAYSALYPEKEHRKVCAHKNTNKYHPYKKSNLYWSAIKELLSISKHFDGLKIRVFHIPQKREVISGKYSLNIKDDVSRTGLEYIPLLDSCEWRRNMFHKRDSHPNDYGYMNLARCVAMHLAN